MAFDLNKLAEVAKPRSEAAIECARLRRQNRDWIRMSQDIALSLHYYLRNSGLTQKELADKMGVSAVYVGKLLKGNENLTLETICKIQGVIGEKLVTVMKPYVSTMTVSLSVFSKFTESVKSEKYYGQQMTLDAYVSATGHVA